MGREFTTTAAIDSDRIDSALRASRFVDRTTGPTHRTSGSINGSSGFPHRASGSTHRSSGPVHRQSGRLIVPRGPLIVARTPLIAPRSRFRVLGSHSLGPSSRPSPAASAVPGCSIGFPGASLSIEDMALRAIGPAAEPLPAPFPTIGPRSADRRTTLDTTSSRPPNSQPSTPNSRLSLPTH
jgi:hypothetical protein